MNIGAIKLDKLSEVDIAKWRDDRLKQVSSESVRREWNLLSSACNIACKEWKWLKSNPMKDVKRPQSGKARTRRISEKEIEKLIFVCGWDGESKPATIPSLIALIFCLAIETGMRAGELLGLEWKNIDLKKQTAHLPETKNGHSRTVPLSKEAVRLFGLVKSKKSYVFNVSGSNLDSIFRKYRDKALIKDLHFHDTRREALSRLSKKLDPFQLAKMSGHRDMRMLLNVYYQEDASVTAKLLD
jgi:integrase